MSVESQAKWLRSDYITTLHNSGFTDSLSARVYSCVCRSDFNVPGFCVIDLGPSSSSSAMRKMMIEIKRRLQTIHRELTGNEMLYLTVDRFDQQQTTRFHLDGAPRESVLMLGYEPTEIQSTVALADFSRCAFDMGLSPDNFLAQHNPMFASGAERVKNYVTQLDGFSNLNYQIVLINNSHATLEGDQKGWQGVLHTATILNPDESKRRVINSTMIGVFPPGTTETVSLEAQDLFTTTTRVRRKGSDKPHLQDDE